VLRFHIALNGVENVTVIEGAAWDAETVMRLEDPHGQVTGGSTRTLEAEAAIVDDPDAPGHRMGLARGDVFAKPLDTWLAEALPVLDRVDLVKLDVEGADLHALRGMADTLARHMPTLFIEDHSIYGYYDRGDLLRLLAKLGYAAQVFTAMLAGGRSAPYIIAHPYGDETPETGAGWYNMQPGEAPYRSRSGKSPAP
jgi:FkbM family methyltransferase